MQQHETKQLLMLSLKDQRILQVQVLKKEGKKLEVKKAKSLDDIKDAINLNVKPNYEHNVAILFRKLCLQN